MDKSAEVSTSTEPNAAQETGLRRSKRTRTAPKPVYVPDENTKFEDDYTDEDDEGFDDEDYEMESEDDDSEISEGFIVSDGHLSSDEGEGSDCSDDEESLSTSDEEKLDDTSLSSCSTSLSSNSLCSRLSRLDEDEEEGEDDEQDGDKMGQKTEMIANSSSSEVSSYYDQHAEDIDAISGGSVLSFDPNDPEDQEAWKEIMETCYNPHTDEESTSETDESNLGGVSEISAPLPTAQSSSF